MSQDDIVRAIQTEILPRSQPAPVQVAPTQAQAKPEDVGLLESLVGSGRRGLSSLADIPAGYGVAGTTAFGSEEALRKKMAEKKTEQKEEAAQETAPGMRVADFQRIYKDKGILEAAKQVPRYVAQNIIESGPQMAGPLLAAEGATAISAPFIGPFAPVVGAAAGMATYGLQQFANLMLRQAQERDDPKEMSIAKAALVSGAEAPFGYLMDRWTLELGNLGAKKAASEVVKELAARKVAGEMVGRGVAAEVAKQAAKGSAIGFIAEAPVEVLEQVGERWQAGLDITGDKANTEYLDALFGAGSAGFGMGAASRGAGAYRDYAKNVKEQTKPPTPTTPTTPTTPATTPTTPTAGTTQAASVTPEQRDTLIATMQKDYGLPADVATAMVDQELAAQAAEQATTPGVATTEAPAPVPAGVDPQRLEQLEIEYINAGFPIKEAKAQALAQAIQEVKDFAEDEATSEQEKANANISAVPAGAGIGTTDVGAGIETDIQQQPGVSAEGATDAQPAGVGSTEVPIAQPAAGEIAQSGALEEARPQRTVEEILAGVRRTQPGALTIEETPPRIEELTTPQLDQIIKDAENISGKTYTIGQKFNDTVLGTSNVETHNVKVTRHPSGAIVVDASAIDTGYGPSVIDPSTAVGMSDEDAIKRVIKTASYSELATETTITPAAPPVAPPVVTPKAPAKEIKTSINVATQILKKANLPYSLDLLAQFTDKNTGLVSKDAVLAYAAQQKPSAAGKKTVEMSETEIDQTLEDFHLDPEAKKAAVIKFATKLVAQGVLTQAELDPLTRMSKDRDLGVEDVLGELETTLRIKREASGAPDGVPSIKPDSNVQAGYEIEIKRVSDALDELIQRRKELEQRRSNPDKAQKAALGLINTIINKWEALARQKPKGTYGEFEIDNLVKNMRDDPGMLLDYAADIRTIDGRQITENTIGAYYKQNKPSVEDVNEVAAQIQETQTELNRLHNEAKVEREVTSKLLAGKFEAAINQKISLGTISREDARFYLAIANGNTKLALELIGKRTPSGKLGRIHQLVAKLLLAANITPKINFYNPSDPLHGGVYSYTNDTVQIDAGSYIQGQGGSSYGYNAYPSTTQLTATFLHELVHAATLGSLSKAYLLLTYLRQGGTESFLTQEQRDYIHSQEYLAAKNIIEVFDWLVTNHGEKFTNLRTDAKYTYGATNPWELVAEAFLDEKLHNILAGITLPESLAPRGQAPNAWEWFLSAIRNLINIKGVPNNALEQIMRSTTEVMRTRKPTLARNTTEYFTDTEMQGYSDAYKRYKARTDVNVPSASGAVPSTVASVQPSGKPTSAAVQKVKQTGKKVSKAMAAIQASKNADAVVQGISAGLDARNWKDWLPLLKDNYDALSSINIGAILKTISTSMILDWKGAEIPALQRINDLTQKMSAMRASMNAAFASKADKLRNFIRKQGQSVLGDAMHLARLHEISPTKYTNRADALANDPDLKAVTAKITDPQYTTAQQRAYKGEAKKRTNAINEVFDAWDALGKQAGGHEMYKMVRQFYMDNYNIVRSILNTQIQALPIDAAAKAKLLKSVRLMQEQERVDDKGNKQKAFPEEYFPFMRYGDYWLRVKGGPAGRAFYTFESAADRSTFLRQEAARLKKDPKDGTIFSAGNDLSSLRKDFSNGSAMLQEMFAAIDKSTASSKISNSQEADAFKEDLKDQLYQVYLMTLPERSIRKQFVHAKNVTGFSSNVFRNFKTSAVKLANQASKLRFSSEIHNEISAARDSLAGRPPLDMAKLGMFVDEVVYRAKEEMNPPPPNQIVAKVNQFAYMWLLTAPASAAVQFISVPIMTMNRLNVDYGYTNAAKAFARYLPIYKTIGITTKEPNGTVTYSAPSIGTSKVVTNNPILKAAFQAAIDRQITTATNISVLTDSARTPAKSYLNSVATATQQIFALGTGMFNGVERLSREMTYMMAFELEYAKTKAFDASVEKAAKITFETLGRYDSMERPRILRNPVGKVLGQFHMYAGFMTAFFIRNAYSAMKVMNPKESLRAVHLLTGVLLTGAMFHGVTGSPFYSSLCSLIDLILNSGGDDEEKRKRRIKNPLTADSSDLRFRYEWLPQNFGNIMVPGLDGRDHKFSAVLEKGPISVLTDINIGSRTSFNNMWFRSAPEGKDWKETAFNIAEANLGPGISAGANFLSGVENLVDGKIQRGLEGIAPAIFKGGLTAIRFGSEGAQTRNHDELLKRNELNGMNLAAQALGFAPTRLAQMQERNYAIKDVEVRAGKEKSKLLSELKDLESNPNRTRNDARKLERRIDQHNRRYEEIEALTISEDTIENSLDAYAERKEKTIRGKFTTEETEPYIEKLQRNAGGPR